MRRDNPYLQACDHLLFCSLCSHTDNHIFDNFLKISDRFSKISKGSPKINGRLHERFGTNISEKFRRLPIERISKITEDC